MAGSGPAPPHMLHELGTGRQAGRGSTTQRGAKGRWAGAKGRRAEAARRNAAGGVRRPQSTVSSFGRWNSVVGGDRRSFARACSVTSPDTAT